MASEKISDMPDASQVLTADVVPIVQGGQNLKVIRPVYLAAVAGETIAIQSPNAQVKIDASENIDITFPNGQTFHMTQSSVVFFAVNGVGAVTITPPLGQATIIGTIGGTRLRVRQSATAGANLVQFVVSSGGIMSLLYGATSVLGVSTIGRVTLNGIAGQNWEVINNGATIKISTAGDISIITAPGASMNITYVPLTPGDWAGSPNFVQDAIDRLAAAVAGLLGGPIP